MPHLPAEILCLVVAELTEVKDRLCLLQTCRQWRALLSNEVYRSLQISGVQIRRLLALALHNPQLALSIRELDVFWSKYHADGRDKVPLEEAVLALVDRTARAEEAEKLRADLNGGDGDAWVALLLISLPNLTHLAGYWENPTPWITRILSRVALRQHPFDVHPVLQCLTSLTTTSDDNHDYYAPYQFLPFLYLPSMRELSLSAVKDYEVLPREEEEEEGHPAIRAARGTSPVTSLTLENDCNGRYGMVDFITACANLKRFTYQHFFQVVWGSRYSEFRPRLFYTPLYTQRHSLEVLHLNHEGDCDDSGDDSEDEDDEWPAPYNRWFGSLADFARLQELRIRLPNLLNIHPKDTHEVVTLKDILPRSIRYLHLTDCAEEHSSLLVTNLQDLLSKHAALFPSFEEILICSSSAESPDPRPPLPQFSGPYRERDIRISSTQSAQFAALKDICSGLGIKFTLSLGDAYRVRYADDKD
ncbi:hypothetical protein BDV12DRAFT_177458, partial [Aspergillus spectabilis]